jgi:hypothetical protein
MGIRRDVLGATLALVLAWAMLTPTPAGAFDYVTKQATVGAGESTRIVKDCPGTSTAVGGGIKGPKFMEQRVSSVGPFDDQDLDDVADDGWAARVDGFALSALPLKLFVICGGGHYEYVDHLDFPIPATSGLGVISGLCFPGTLPIGGGGYASPDWAELRMTSSRPWDGADQDTDPDDAWVAGAHNASGQTQYLDATVICGEGNYEYVTAYETVDAGNQGGARVRCSKDAHLAGGGFLAGGASQVALSSMYPRDGADANHVPDDAWVARIENLGSSDHGLHIYAVCAP